MLQQKRHPSSYRDPAGFIYNNDNIILRQVNLSYKEHYDHLIKSGLYDELVKREWLIPHEEITSEQVNQTICYKTLRPQQLLMITFPYEWSFNMLKDAALLTLNIAQTAMEYGMILKDATPFNIQMNNGKMIFIDTLSFEKYNTKQPWIAYRQFCECFLAPLALMHYLKIPLNNLLLSYPNGIPLHIAQQMLPYKSRWNLHNYLHLHLHGNVSKKASLNSKEDKKVFTFNKLKNILISLETAVQSYQLQYKNTWSDYYQEANEREGYMDLKKAMITSWLESRSYKTAFDAGSNEGNFSKLLANNNIFCISADGDHFAIDTLYKQVKKDKLPITPLVIDLTHPTPAIGINLEERSSLFDRLNTDVVLALALIHHLAIGSNIPFDLIAQTFQRLGKELIIEFVPKMDEKVQFMLQQKQDIFSNYTEEEFLKSFNEYYDITDRKEIGQSGRILFLMKSKHA